MNASPCADTPLLSVPSPRHLWLSLFGAGLVLTIAGGGIWVADMMRTASEPGMMQLTDAQLLVIEKSVNEPPFEERVARAAGLKSVRHTVEGGKAVIRIRATADGDELVVDAATGKLLAVAGRSTSPMKMAIPCEKPTSDS